MSKTTDMIRKANCVLSSFSSAYPPTLTKCLILLKPSWWSPVESFLQVVGCTYNKIIRRIWHLSGRCHTGILHSDTDLSSPRNMLFQRFQKFINSAVSSHVCLIKCVFYEVRDLCFTSVG